MFNNKIFKAAVISAIIGLLLILAVIVTGSAYPDVFFTVGTLTGLILVFISNGLLLVSWLGSIGKDVKDKNYLSAFLTAFMLLVLVIVLLRKQ